MATENPNDQPNGGLPATILTLASIGLVTPSAPSPFTQTITVIVLIVVLALGATDGWGRRTRPCQH